MGVVKMMKHIFLHLKEDNHSSHKITFDNKVVIISTTSIDTAIDNHESIDEQFINQHKHHKLHHNKDTRSKCKRCNCKYKDERYNPQFKRDYYDLINDEDECYFAIKYKYDQSGNMAILFENDYNPSEDDWFELARIADINAKYNTKL
jgi:hypothetical protein